MITETGHPLCVDNFSDYVAWDRVVHLASGLDHDAEPDSPLVNAVLGYVERLDGEYSLNREDATEILNAARHMT